MASSTPSLSKTSNPPLSSSTRLIPHQPQFMQETGTQHHRSSPYEKKLVKIQNTQFIGENLMPINFSSSSSSINSELEMSKMLLQQEQGQGQRNRRKSSRILRGLSPAPTNTSLPMSYPVLSSEPLPTATPASGSGSAILHPTITNSNYHLKWNDHVNSTVSAIQCLLANETFVDVTLVCDEDVGNENNNNKNKSEKNLINGSYNNSRKISSRHRRFQHKDLDEDDLEANFADEDDEDDMEDGESWNHTSRKSNHYQIKLKAHKVILSTCSEYFRKIFSENPCKHPVIVLKDFQEWEVRSLLDFMYKGQLSVQPDRLDTLMKAADALQIRGLRECIEKSEEWAKMRETEREQRMIEGGSDNEVESLEAKTRVLNRTSDNNTKLLIPTSISMSTTSHPHSRSQSLGVDNESGPSSPKLLNLSMSGGEGMMMRTSPHLNLQPMEATDGPQTSIADQTAPTRLNNHHQTNPSASSPPFPRRKQARPRRRSGDFVAQDLRIMVTPPPTRGRPVEMPPTSQELAALHDFHIHHNNNKIHDFALLGKGGFDRPPHLNHLISNHFLKNWAISGNGSPMRTPPHSSPVKHELDSDEETPSPTDRFRSPPGTPGSSPSPIYEAKQFARDGTPLYNDPISGLAFKTSPPSPSFFMNLNNGHPLLSGGHNSDSESNNPELASTPPSVFSPAGFPHNGGGGNHNNNSSPHHGQPWPGLPMGPAPIFGRHRAQHSAPRGGPPRAWSNADLTEALHNVWNKKMTTSQASRIFGIPYNSLLMYVRGKYGKSLKLDLLKKGLDLALENSNNGGANSLNSNGAPPQPPSIPGLSSTLISNNNNNNNRTTPPSSQSQKSKSRSHYSNSTAEDSPPSGLTLTHSHSGNGNSSNIGHNGGGGSAADRTDPQDIIPPGFNPFSAVSSIFGDYPPPFPFPPSALSHILPPVNHLSMDKVTLTRRNDGDK